MPDFFALEQRSPFPDKAQPNSTRLEPTTKVVDYYKKEITPHGPAPHCPMCDRAIGELAWNPPYQVELDAFGLNFPEIIYGSGQNMLVTEGFRDGFLKRHLRGLSGFEPVEIAKIRKRRTKAGDPPRYLKACVAFSRTAIDLKASEFEIEGKVCDECRTGQILRSWKRVVFEDGTWDGLDVFKSRGKGGVFCTGRFVGLCNDLDATNMKFTPIAEHAHDYYPSCWK